MPRAAPVCLLFPRLAIHRGAVGGVSLEIQQCTVILVSRLTVFCTFCLLLGAGQQPAALCTHMQAFYVCFSCLFHFLATLSKQLKTFTCTPRIHFHSKCSIHFQSKDNVLFSEAAVVHNSFHTVGFIVYIIVLQAV